MIEVVDLVRVLSKKRVLDGLSFEARPGEVTGFLGPNGAGKTTTMRILATLLAPTQGTVRICGRDVVKDAHEVRASIGLVTEEPNLMERFTVREHLVFSARAHGLKPARINERLEMMVDVLNLSEQIDQRGGKLSRGNRQKVSLARALLHDPPVLLLDEPTVNLDVVTQASLQAYIRSHDVRGRRTILLSTHDMYEAEAICDRVVGIVAGKTVVQGTQDEIIAKTGAKSFRDAFLGLLGHAAMSGSASTVTASDPG